MQKVLSSSSEQAASGKGNERKIHRSSVFKVNFSKLKSVSIVDKKKHA